MLRLHRRGDRGKQVIAQEVRDSRRGVGVESDLVREVETVVGAVGGVQVDGHVRIVLGQQPGHGARFRRLQLGAVTVEVEVLRVVALAHASHRAMLRTAVAHVHPLVAVGVVDRRDEQHDILEPTGALAPGQRTQQPERGFLTLDLAGVDVAPG